MSVGDEDENGDQHEMRHSERRAHSKCGTSGNMEGEGEASNSTRHAECDVMTETPSRNVW